MDIVLMVQGKILYVNHFFNLYWKIFDIIKIPLLFNEVVYSNPLRVDHLLRVIPRKGLKITILGKSTPLEQERLEAQGIHPRPLCRKEQVSSGRHGDENLPGILKTKTDP